MTRIFRVLLLTMLVATPAAELAAQTQPSNPWYMPPQPQYQQPSYQAPAYQPQAAQSVPYGFGAGYAGQPSSIYQPPTQQQPYQPRYEMAAPSGPATTGVVPDQGSVFAMPAYGATAPLQGPPTATVQPGYQGYRGYTSNAQAYAAQPAYQPPPAAGAMQPGIGYPQPAPYGYAAQPFGNYPPLGSDPTEVTKPKSNAPAQPAADATAQSYGAAPQANGTYAPYPGFAGPTTLSPGYGGFGGGLPPVYPAPLGASPNLGMPFF